MRQDIILLRQNLPRGAATCGRHLVSLLPEKTVHAIKSYLYHVEQKFSRELDYFHLRGQDNILRYLPVGKVMVRLHPDDSLFDGIHAGAFVLDGSPRMPPFGELLTTEQIRDLVGYIRTLCACRQPSWAERGPGG